jgi:hypothetical protein
MPMRGFSVRQAPTCSPWFPERSPAAEVVAGSAAGGRLPAVGCRRSVAGSAVRARGFEPPPPKGPGPKPGASAIPPRPQSGQPYLCEVLRPDLLVPGLRPPGLPISGSRAPGPPGPPAPRVSRPTGDLGSVHFRN